MQMLSVNFHYIRDEKPESGIYPRSVAEFKFQIAELSRYYEFLSLSELKKLILDGGNSRGKYCILTFDDNLKEQMCAFEYLESLSIPAIFFSTTLPYLEQSVHDVHKMHHIYTQYTDEQLGSYLDEKYGFSKIGFTEDQMLGSYSYDTDLKKKIKLFLNFVMTKEQRVQFIDELFSQSVEGVNQFVRDFYMSKGDLKSLAAKGMLGTHTHSHYPLASLSNEKIDLEIRTSIEYLKELTGTKMEAISYPYGRHGAVDDNVALISEKLGLKAGFTMNRGFNRATDFKRPLMLNRVDTNDAPGGKLDATEYVPEK